MKRQNAFDLYTDYLLSSPKLVSCTGLSDALHGGLKHDYLSDFLNQLDMDSVAYWKLVKPFVRQIETQSSYLSLDDTYIEKPHTDENELISWHFDHSKRRKVKGINMINLLLSSDYQEDWVNCPVAFDLVRKTPTDGDAKTGQEKRRSEVSKNEMVRDKLAQLVFQNQIQFKYVLFDTWFASAENMVFMAKKLKKTFICPLKNNRLVARSRQDKLQGKFQQVSQIVFQTGRVYQVWLKGLPFAVALTREVFTNQDGSTGERYFVCNDTSLNFEQITAHYQKRWKVEELHKSLKSNLNIEKSPTQKEVSQHNHIFCSLMAFIKLERLKIKQKMNHFALKSHLYVKMIQTAMHQIQVLRTQQL